MNFAAKFAATVAVFIATAGVAQAVTIYGEDFTGQDSYGVGASGVLNTGNGETWTVSSSADGSGTDFSGIDSSDYFNVQNGVMEVKDSDQVVYWISPVVDISNYTNLNLSGTFMETGDIENESAGVSGDYINVEYSLDGGLTFAFLDNINGFGSATSSLTGDIPTDADWGSTILSEGLADGTAFQLRIALQNSANTEYLSFDDIILAGDAVTSVPLPASGLLLVGAVGLIRRRRKAA